MLIYFKIRNKKIEYGILKIVVNGLIIIIRNIYSYYYDELLNIIYVYVICVIKILKCWVNLNNFFFIMMDKGYFI